MDDELRKAAQVALAAMEKEWDTKLSKGNAYSFMKAARALRAALAKNANAAPDSSLAPLIESLIGEYWDIAHEEGKTGISHGDLANQVLGRIRNALIAWSQRAAPQDQDAKDAADIFWDYEDGEYCVRSIQEICENACDRGAENGAVLRVNQAKSLPHIFLRLIVPENPDDSVDYITISESEAIATMQQEQKP